MRFEFGPRQVAIIALGTALYAVMNWLLCLVPDGCRERR
ncbi:MAG: hypothetical protein KatS3mg014_2663 [Actinomycetota bacterium]|nr:MAG: hypothetical protein KatS3mg014_2663 [Actinomycetota bacterium]